MSADDNKFWNRDELYQEVWSTPMRTLAKKYGISDVGLAKVCRKLSIPRPGLGYWARKEAGQKGNQPPLPPLKEKIVLRKPDPRKEPPKLSDSATEPELAQIEKVERTASEVLLKRGNMSHPLVAQARSILKSAGADDRKILWAGGSYLHVRVSKDSLDRALRIMAAVISAIEDAGFSVGVETGESKKSFAKIYGQQISFGLSEKTDRVEILAPPKGGLLERVLTFGGKPVTLEPSGKFSIEVWNGWGSTQIRWRDRKSRSLEEQLPQIVAGFMRIALAERAEKERRAAEERERQLRAEERARLEESIKAERSKIRALDVAASRWSRAERIRSFVSAAHDAAVQNGQPVNPGSPFGDWIVWAGLQADRLDPLKASPCSVIDRIAETAPEYPSYYSYGYRKPDPVFRFPKPVWRMQ